MVKAKSRVGKELKSGEGKIEDGEGIRWWWWNLSVVKAKLRVLKEFEGVEGKFEGSEGIRGWQRQNRGC